MASSNNPKSIVWKFYDLVKTDTSNVKCKLCEKLISRGGKEGKTHNTTNMNKHLKSKHKDELVKEENRTKEEQQYLSTKRKLDHFFTSPPSKAARADNDDEEIASTSSAGKQIYNSLFYSSRYKYVNKSVANNYTICS